MEERIISGEADIGAKYPLKQSLRPQTLKSIYRAG